MRPNFPGMDPWLEHPALWPDVHNRLIAAVADALAPSLAPKYYVGVETRAYRITSETLALIGVADLAVATDRPAGPVAGPDRDGGIAVEVEVPMAGLVRDTYLEIRALHTGKLVTVIEILSRVNKLPKEGRKKYLRKRERILVSRTNLVEIDLLRDGKPMPYRARQPVTSDYRILISRDRPRPQAQLYPFVVQSPIPTIPLPLLPGDDEPTMDLGAIIHALYDRARFDLRLDYKKPAVPPLDELNMAWAREVVGG